MNRPPKIGTKPVPPLDDDGNDSTDVVDIQIFKEDIKAYSLLQRTFDSNIRQVNNVIWGQYSDDMMTKIRAHEKYNTVAQGGIHKNDPVQLLKMIKDIMSSFQSQRIRQLSITTSMHQLYNLRQYQHELSKDFKQRLVNAVDVVYHCGGTIGEFEVLITEAAESDGTSYSNVVGNENQLKKYRQKAKDKFIGILMIFLANEAKFKRLKNELENDFTKGNNEYPESLADSNPMLYYRVDDEAKKPN